MLFGEGFGTRHDRRFFRRQEFIQHSPEIHEWTRDATAG
jgi:hypothetical protein